MELGRAWACFWLLCSSLRGLSGSTHACPPAPPRGNPACSHAEWVLAGNALAVSKLQRAPSSHISRHSKHSTTPPPFPPHHHHPPLPARPARSTQPSRRVCGRPQPFILLERVRVIAAGDQARHGSRSLQQFASSSNFSSIRIHGTQLIADQHPRSPSTPSVPENFPQHPSKRGTIPTCGQHYGGRLWAVDNRPSA